MSGPKTVEAAAALNELKGFYKTGIFMGGDGLEGDTICAFVDADGVSKRVHCIRRSRDGPDEWVKSPFGF